MKLVMRLLMITALAFIAAGCSEKTEQESQQADYENISVNEAKNMILTEEVNVVDVRTPQEYEEGHVPNSTLLPLQELEDRYAELNPEDKLVIICRSGNRSAQASEFLISKGYTNVYNVVGGMNSWDGEVEK